jgi:VCBS repeat-containing protein
VQQEGGNNVTWGIKNNIDGLKFVAPPSELGLSAAVQTTVLSDAAMPDTPAFTVTDTLFIHGASVDDEDIDREPGSAILRIDFDGDGLADATVTMEGTYRLASFVTQDVEDGTYIRYLGNSLPEAVEDTFTTSESAAFKTGSVLLNDTDGDDDELDVVGLDLAGTLGVVTDNGDGTLGYDPNGAFNDLLKGETATDSFIYLVSDGTETVSGEVTVTITGEGSPEPVPNAITGTEDSNSLVGTDGADAIRSLGGSYDRMTGGEGADEFIFGSETSNGIRERDVIMDYEVGIDRIVLEDGTTVASIRETSSQVVVFLDGDRDAIYVRGEGVTADNLTIVSDDVFDFV